jgi:peptidoglycan/xylan/chitin deacetylase (PgdA/CDA1 family)
MYHSLDDTGSCVSIAPDVFASQMRGLAEAGWRGVSLGRALAERKDSRWPEKTFVLTFDDGYQSVVRHALPTLGQFGFTATIYALARHLGDDNLCTQPPETMKQQPLATVDELRVAVQVGHEIGAHTLTHPVLPHLDAESMRREIVASRTELEVWLDVAVDTFAYPFGRVNEATHDVAAERYQSACTTEHRRAGIHGDPHLLPRIEMFYFRRTENLLPLVRGELDWRLAARRWLREARRRLVELRWRPLTCAEVE